MRDDYRNISMQFKRFQETGSDKDYTILTSAFAIILDLFLLQG